MDHPEAANPIAVLRALGYSKLEISLRYLELALASIAAGILAAIAFGIALLLK